MLPRYFAWGCFFKKQTPPSRIGALVGCSPASVQAWGRMSFKIWRYGRRSRWSPKTESRRTDQRRSRKAAVVAAILEAPRISRGLFFVGVRAVRSCPGREGHYGTVRSLRQNAPPKSSALSLCSNLLHGRFMSAAELHNPVAAPNTPPRHDWTRDEIRALFDLPLSELIFRAQGIHRAHFDPTEVQLSTLLSIKTGGCPEDCAYCPQSAQYDTGVDAEKLMPLDKVLAEARAARDAGASRFCMGAAWRSPKERDLDRVCAMVEGVKELGLETCATLGMLTASQATKLRAAGLDYYNHNLDTSPEFYGQIITTRTYDDRLETLEHVRNAGIHVCCGGIVGMGETREDRIGMIATLANLPVHPESVPINMLVRVAGTPLADRPPLEPIEFVRTVAVARITMPRSMVRLSAGRETMSEETQALCFLAGANSIFCGPRLLTTPNPKRDRDQLLMDRLGLQPMA